MARECFKKHCVFYSNCLIAVNFTNFLYTVFLVWRWPLLVLGQVLLKRPLLLGWKNSLRVRTLSFIGTSFMPMLIRWDLGYSIWELNPSYSNISICVLDTVIYTFPTSKTWRICLTIKSLLRWKLFTVYCLFSRLWYTVRRNEMLVTICSNCNTNSIIDQWAPSQIRILESFPGV